MITKMTSQIFDLEIPVKLHNLHDQILWEMTLNKYSDLHGSFQNSQPHRFERPWDLRGVPACGRCATSNHGGRTEVIGGWKGNNGS